MNTIVSPKPWHKGYVIVFCLLALSGYMISCSSARYAESESRDSETVHSEPPPGLGRGINLGNYLEAKGYEGAWSGGRKIEATDLERIRNRGFTTVRIPVRWSDHCQKDPPYQIDAAFMARVQEVFDWALKAELNVVLNVHHYEEMMNESRLFLPKHRERLAAIWNQICNAFPLDRYPKDSVVFELLNEPNGAVGYDEWNAIIAELTALIWDKNQQAQRKIMIGTANWGGVGGIYKLRLPDTCNRDNTIITFHFYEPFQFTHQGAEWVSGSDRWIGTRWLGTPQEQQHLSTLIDGIVAWNRGAHRNFELFLGEFGSYGKYARPIDRKAWTSFVVQEAEKRGMSWAYWEYSQGFGAWDPDAGRWRDEITSALIPQ